jgi:hypothetical protein
VVAWTQKRFPPVQFAGILRRVETMPDSNDVLPTARRADGDGECLVSGIKLINQDGLALASAWLRLRANVHLWRTMKLYRMIT